MVLANPEIAGLPTIVVGLVAAGGLAMAGMIVGLSFAAFYMYMVIWGGMEPWSVIDKAGIGIIAALLNGIVMVAVSLMTALPHEELQEFVESVRYPGAYVAEVRESLANQSDFASQ